MLLKNTLTEVSKNLQTVEERFARGIIRHDIYERFSEKLRAEKRSIEEKLEQAGNKLSRPLLAVPACSSTIRPETTMNEV